MKILCRLLAWLRPSDAAIDASAQERMDILKRIKFPCC